MYLCFAFFVKVVNPEDVMISFEHVCIRIARHCDTLLPLKEVNPQNDGLTSAVSTKLV